MRQDKDNSWLDPLLARQVRREPAEFDLDQWAKRYPEEAGLLERGFAGTGRNKQTLTLKVWRRIMESKVTCFSAAAVVVFAGGLVLLNPFGTSREGILLAAQERMAQVDTMILKGQKVFTSVEDPNLSIPLAVTKYVSRQYGYMEEGSVNGNVVYRVVMNMPEKMCMIDLGILNKRCLRFPCTETQIKLMESMTPTGVIDLMLQADHKELGRMQVNGVEAEGFELHDVNQVKDILPKYLFDIQQGRATVWVSTKEHLPVHMEGNLRIGKSLATMFMDMSLHETTSLESCNVELDPKLFSPEIPAGHTEFKLTDALLEKVGLTLPGNGR